MKLTMRALVAGAFLTASAVVCITAYPALAQELSADIWDGPDWRTRLTDSERRAHELARQEEVVVKRVALRNEVVNDLIAGRLTADDAIVRFVELNRTGQEMMRRVRERYGGDTDEERAGWQLVSHLRSRQTPRARALADEVAGALARRTGTHG